MAICLLYVACNRGMARYRRAHPPGYPTAPPPPEVIMDEFLELLRLELDLVRRRLRGMAMISRGIVPNLLISQRMVDRVVEAARHFLADETGETMVGLVIEPPDNQPESMP